MIRTLFIIAGSAFLLCLISFAGAAALGGADIDRNGWSWTIDDDGDSIHIESDKDLGPEGTRDIAWSGGDRLIIDVPGEIVFVQGSEAGVQLSGPQSVIDRVSLTDGRLTIKDQIQTESEQTLEGGPVSVRRSYTTYWGSDGLRVTVTAPDVRQFEVQSSADLTIRDYDQDTMRIDLSGSGNVVAAGRTRALELDISGSGDVDLASLTTVDADVDVAGSGDASLAPTGLADISISGSGDVELTTRPARLNQDISGSGDVDELR